VIPCTPKIGLRELTTVLSFGAGLWYVLRNLRLQKSMMAAGLEKQLLRCNDAGVSTGNSNGNSNSGNSNSGNSNNGNSNNGNSNNGNPNNRNSTPSFCTDTTVYGNVKNAYNNLWNSIEANSNLLRTEVWSWVYDTSKEFVYTPLGVLPAPDGSAQTESDVVQVLV
jgi:hypothetical protein